MDTRGWYQWRGDDLELYLRVLPRGQRDAFVAAQGGHYRVRLQAPPVEGRANEALRRFLAGAFGVPLSQVELLAGAQSRAKRLIIRSPRRLPIPVPRP